MRPDISSTQLGGIANLALLARIKPDFVVGFESFTYAKRLDMLLKTLNAIRLASRESTLVRSPFPDSVGRFGILQSFRYAIVPANLGEAAPVDGGEYRLSLNVTFDGGWEPYMRVIHRDLGSLLDAIFCNCVGYPLARKKTFDEYTRWVRAHEVPGGLFYTDSAMTIGDQRYLARVERIQREEADPKAADVRIAGLALKPPPSVDQSVEAFKAAGQAAQAEVVRSSLKALRALYGLTRAYPDNAEGDGDILLRFAQDVLPEFHAVVSRGLLAGNEQAALFATELAWFKPRPKAGPLAEPRLDFKTAPIQAGIVQSYTAITHGCIVLLRIENASQAAAYLAGLEVSKPCDGVHWNVALSVQGLKTLGVPDERIDRFPQEFIEGMEARAGLLGDVRTNHPDRWRRPRLRDADNAPRIELSTVHVVVQLRLAGNPDDTNDKCHPTLLALVQQLDEAEKTGLQVLAVQPMRSYPGAGNITTEAFGFQDGFSQPTVGAPEPKPVRWNDNVAPGEILLGHANDRGDTQTEADPLLDNGCFLVIRKLRQRLDTLEQVLDAAAAKLVPGYEGAAMKDELKARMMGRRLDGTPLVQGASRASNNFNYAGDPNGAQCPFQSHARRANPRDSRPMPRMLRRGMSYGPKHVKDEDLPAERGVVFMAYVASIAEQFEVIQRWIAGGNSSGVLSAHSDPFLGVPERGVPRVFRFLDERGEVVRVDLGDQPLVNLEWGMYLFVPSVDALKYLPSLHPKGEEAAAPAPPPPSRAPASRGAGDVREDLEKWRQRLEDPRRRDAAWAAVHAKGGVMETDYGILCASPTKVLEVLKDPGSTYSVCGYGKRMDLSIGLGYLGLDTDRHTAQAEASGVNAEIEKIDANRAFGLTTLHTKKVLERFRQQLGSAGSSGDVETPVDVLSLAETVVAQLCRDWFGLPDGKLMVPGGRTPQRDGPPRCPGHFMSVARYVFSPHPSDTVTGDGKAHGAALLTAVREFVQQQPDLSQWELSHGIQQCLIKSKLAADDPDIVPRTIAGVMLGFPPTVLGNFIRVAYAWFGGKPEVGSSAPRPLKSFWDLQAELLAFMSRDGGDLDYKKAARFLEAPLLGQMSKAPVPEMIWRTRAGESVDTAPATPPIVLGLIGAMQDPAADPLLMFGGPRYGDDKTKHACPGYGMAKGVMLGMFAGLMRAGTIRPTASPTVVTLIES